VPSTPGCCRPIFASASLLTPLERPRGLPIGNLTSQFLANLHLNAVNHCLRALPGDLADLSLRLHPSKTRLHRTATGASFVGFHVIGGRIRLRNHSLLRIRRGLRPSARALRHRRISLDQAQASARSWDAHADTLARTARQRIGRLGLHLPIVAINRVERACAPSSYWRFPSSC
jgi:hypothetical protein